MSFVNRTRGTATATTAARATRADVAASTAEAATGTTATATHGTKPGGSTIVNYNMAAPGTSIAAGCALATSLNICLGGESLGAIIYIERAHRGSRTAVLAIATHIACCR